MKGTSSLTRRRAKRFDTNEWYEKERIRLQEPGHEDGLLRHVRILAQSREIAAVTNKSIESILDLALTNQPVGAAEQKENEITDERARKQAKDNGTTEAWELASLVAARQADAPALRELVTRRQEAEKSAAAKSTTLAYELRKRELVDELVAEVRTAQVVAARLAPSAAALAPSSVHLRDERAYDAYRELARHVDLVTADKERVAVAATLAVRDGTDIGVALEKTAALPSAEVKEFLAQAWKEGAVLDVVAEERKRAPQDAQAAPITEERQVAIAEEVRREALRHHDAVMTEAQQGREQAQSPVAEAPKREEKGQGPSLDDELERIILEDDSTRGERNEKDRAASKEMAQSWEAERAQEEGLTSFATSTIKGETKERVRAEEAREKSEQEKPEISRDGRTNAHAVELGMIEDPSQAAYQSTEEASASSEETATAAQGQARKVTAEAEAAAEALVAQEEAAAKIKAAQAAAQQELEQEAPRRGRRR